MYFDPEEWNPLHCRNCEHYEPSGYKCGVCTLEGQEHETEDWKACNRYKQARF